MIPNRIQIRLIAWVTMLLPSTLTLILWREFGGGEPTWWYLVPLTGLSLILILTMFLGSLSRIREYVALMLMLFLMGFGGGWTFGVIPWVRASEAWISLTYRLSSGLSDLAVHLLRLTPAAMYLFFTRLRNIDHTEINLSFGDINSLVKPSRLLGVNDKITWVNMSIRFASVFGLGTLIFLMVAAKPDFRELAANINVLPFVVLIAALNAFNEEFTLRAAPIHSLRSLGERDALALTTVFFGLGHYYGVPYGLTGVLLSGFLGWFNGKSIIETHGFFLAWFTHLVPDLVIFCFLLVFG